MPPRSCDVAVEQYEIREPTFANYGDCVKKGKTTKGCQQHSLLRAALEGLEEIAG